MFDSNIVNCGRMYSSVSGTASTVGQMFCMLGNEIPSGTDGNSRGYLRIYDSTNYYIQFNTRDSYTKNVGVVIPNSSGTLGIINYGTSDPSSIDHGSIYLVYE